MKYLLIACLLFTATVAYAQQPTELTLKVAPAEADLIWKGLRELPVKDVEALMAKMRQQVMDQTTKPAEPKKE